MEWNKYNEFYYSKSFNELIEKVRLHRINNTTLDSDWYEALLLHISERSLSELEMKIFSHTLSTDPLILKIETEKMVLKSDEEKEHETNKLGLIINAGKSLKAIAIIVSIFWVVSVISLLIVMNLRDVYSLITVWYLIGGIAFLLNFIVLSLLYSSGKDLENSIHS